MLDDDSRADLGELDDDDLLTAVGPVSADVVGRCVGVVGGRGGAGASTLAAALAVAAASSTRVALLDLDPLGGGLDLLLGLEDTAGLRWPALAAATGRLSSSALAAALPAVSGVAVLSWDCGDLMSVPAEAVWSVVDAALRGFDVVVLDLPRGLDATAAPAVERCDELLMVVPAEVRAVAAASRLVRVLAGSDVPVRAVVRGPAPSGLTGPEVAAFLGVPLAGWLRSEPRLHRSVDKGVLGGLSRRGPLAMLCAGLVEGLLSEDRRARASTTSAVAA